MKHHNEIHRKGWVVTWTDERDNLKRRVFVGTFAEKQACLFALEVLDHWPVVSPR